MSSIETKTYTDFWSMEKKLYSIYDVSLPAPVSIRTVGIFLGIGVPWAFLLNLLGLPFDPPWFLIYLIPPVGLAYFGSKPVFEGKNIFQYAISRGKYVFQSKYYKGLSPMIKDDDVYYHITSKVWHPDASEDIISNKTSR
jgi:hypothetical protein